MVKLNLWISDDNINADIKGKPAEIIELVASVMLEDELVAKLVFAAVEVYKTSKLGMQ